MNPGNGEKRGGEKGGGEKGYRAGTDRTVAPIETLAKVVPLASTMGITRIANVTGLDRIGVPVVMVCRPNSRSIAVAQGKGPDLDAAKASGLMEAAELWHAERIDQPLRLGHLEDLRGRCAVADVGSLPRPANSPFHARQPILWIEGRDLYSDAACWVPYEMVHTNYTVPAPQGHGCFAASSNGLASGNCLLEAISHALCEVIERDATTIWWQQGQAALARTGLRLDTVDDPVCLQVIEKIAAAGLRIGVWETTSDIGVAAFFCAIVDQRQRFGHPGLGAGCHPGKSVALLRALTEAVQDRMTLVTGARDDLREQDYRPRAFDERVRAVESMLDATGLARDFGMVPSFAADRFDADLDGLLGRLAAVGIEQAIAVDLGRPEIGIAVVRVIVPGLEGPHDDAGYVPGARARAVRREPR